MAERGSCYDRSSDGLAGGPWQERRAAGAVRGVTGFGIAGAWPQGARVTAHVSGHVTGCSSCSTVEVQRITVIKQVQSHFFFFERYRQVTARQNRIHRKLLWRSTVDRK